MTNPNLRLDWPVIPESAAACNNTAEEVRQQLDVLRTYVMDLQHVWQGVASNTFGSLMTDYDIYARTLHDALVDIGSGLNGNYVNYEQTETANINSLVNVNGAIPGSHGSAQAGGDPSPSSYIMPSNL